MFELWLGDTKEPSNSGLRVTEEVLKLILYFIVLGLLEKAFILNFNFYFLIFASTFEVIFSLDIP